MSSKSIFHIVRKGSMLVVDDQVRTYCISIKRINYFSLDLKTSTFTIDFGQSHIDFTVRDTPEAIDTVYKYIETQIREFYESYD